MPKIIIETIQDPESLTWALSVSYDGGEEFLNTGYIYADESYAHRKLSKVLSFLTDESIEA